MDFGADTDQIETLANDLKTSAGEMRTIIGNIYSKIEGLNGNGWSGQGYDDFYAECAAYKNALEQIPGVIEDFATFFSGTAKGNAETMHTGVQDGYTEIEGA